MRSLSQELTALNEANLYRSFRSLSSDQDAEVTFEGRPFVNFSSNNYLGLANHPRLKQAAIRATEKFGTGSGASRLVTGSMDSHRELEEALARFKGAPAALLFNSGYHANLSLLTALLQEGDEVYSDELNHASIVDGCRLSRATVKVYRHADASHLQELLSASKKEVSRRLIVTDSIFSMDGDGAPLKDLAPLAERFDAWLLVDEAHATGIFGPRGRGLVEAIWPKRPAYLEERLIQMGTLGKALGSFGAFAAGSKELIEILINKARPFIYTTALPPAVCAASLEALKIVDEEPALRKNLWERVRSLSQALKGRKIISPIVPWIVGDSEKALNLSQKLWEEGLWVTAIRAPTVPRGTERLRITLMATHTEEQIGRLVRALNPS